MAQLMMHRDVLKNYGKFPTKVQKKITELHRKFEEDNTQASINLEKLAKAKDPKVRSARVGDDYRAKTCGVRQHRRCRNTLAGA